MACRTTGHVTAATWTRPPACSRRRDSDAFFSKSCEIEYVVFWLCVLTDPPAVFLSEPSSTFRSLVRLLTAVTMRAALATHETARNAMRPSTIFHSCELEARGPADLAASLGASFRELAPSSFTSMLDEIIPPRVAGGTRHEALHAWGRGQGGLWLLYRARECRAVAAAVLLTVGGLKANLNYGGATLTRARVRVLCACACSGDVALVTWSLGAVVAREESAWPAGHALAAMGLLRVEEGELVFRIAQFDVDATCL
eukprot:scaffold24425_cov66-Phaeocystis_antarctica.AAC.3